jgi:hypothetical protein
LIENSQSEENSSKESPNSDESSLIRNSEIDEKFDLWIFGFY